MIQSNFNQKLENQTTEKTVKLKLYTFRKRHLQSGGYFVKTKLNTFPTTGMSASASEEQKLENCWLCTLLQEGHQKFYKLLIDQTI